MADLLAEHAETLGEPYARHLAGKTRELRFHMHRGAVRVSYWLAPGHRIVLLTVFVKTRQHDHREVARALGCEQGHASGHPDHGPATQATSGSGSDERHDWQRSCLVGAHW